jgi:hypothetical protein
MNKSAFSLYAQKEKNPWGIMFFSSSGRLTSIVSAQLSSTADVLVVKGTESRYGIKIF